MTIDIRESTSRHGGVLKSMSECLARRSERGLLRSITIPGKGSVDFSSNDYLGIARSRCIEKLIEEELKVAQGSGNKQPVLGSTGSRLLTGNSEYYEKVESELALFYRAESCLLFNSGYDLNFGLFSCIAHENDTILYDEEIHNSVREGLRNSRGSVGGFKHNDCIDLRHKLQQLRADSKIRNVFVSVESIYSMDGQIAPLQQICALCDEYDASLIVDEAHGVGVAGDGGGGVVSGYGLENSTLCRVCTFGKGPGIHGAALVGPQILKEYMLNYCKPLIYSTSLPLHSLASVKVVHEYLLNNGKSLQKSLADRIKLFRDLVEAFPMLKRSYMLSSSAIQCVLVPGNKKVTKASEALNAQGFHVLPIRSPTVQKGAERLRIILHAHNTEQQIKDLVKALSSALD